MTRYNFSDLQGIIIGDTFRRVVRIIGQDLSDHQFYFQVRVNPDDSEPALVAISTIGSDSGSIDVTFDEDFGEDETGATIITLLIPRSKTKQLSTGKMVYALAAKGQDQSAEVQTILLGELDVLLTPTRID